jgi:hypothetical protein
LVTTSRRRMPQVIISKSKNPPVIKEETLNSFRAFSIAGKDAGFRGLDIVPSLLARKHHYFDGLSRQDSLDALLDIVQ